MDMKSSDGVVLFCNHMARRLVHDGRLAVAAKKAFGVHSLVLTYGRDSVNRALRSGFDGAVDLSYSRDGDSRDMADIIAEMAAFERLTGGRSLREDVLQDRWLSGRFSMDWSLRYLASVKDTVDSLLSSERIVAAFGEVNYAAFRVVRRALGARDIPFFMFAFARAYRRFYLDPTFYSKHERCVDLYRSYRNRGVPNDALREAEAAIRRIVEQRRGPTYLEDAMKQGERPRQVISTIRRVLRDNFSNHGRESFPRQRLWRERWLGAKVARRLKAFRAQRHYARLSTTDASERHALYLMHTAPEYQINTCGWPHRDEAHLIERISESLPLNMQLLVKEHLKMVGVRDTGAYDRIAALPNVSFVPATANARDLIANSQLVFTISGNSALEALACAVPAIVFSPIFYTAFEGILRCEDLLELPIMIRRALDGSGDRADIAVPAFAAMYSASRPGTPFSRSGLVWNNEENLRVVEASFIRELADLVPGLDR